MANELQPIGEILSASLSRLGLATSLSEPLSVEEYTKRSVDRYNAKQGRLNITDGYDCKKCLNRGDFASAVERGGGWYEVYTACECMKIRRSIWKMQQSGLSRVIKEHRLSKFKVDADWQKDMLDKAWQYVKQGVYHGSWFYAGGQVGSGKTMLCTGVARELLYRGMELSYIIWEQECKRLKAIINEPEFAGEMHKLEAVEVLYIDDMFKPIKDNSGENMPPSTADLRLAFQLINYRYANRLPTIISSERYISELMELDEATGSRVYEMAKGYTLTINRDKSRNQRRQEDVVI